MLQQLRKYKDTLGRIIGIQKDTTNGKYIMSIEDGYTFVTLSKTTYPNRESCLRDLKRFPRKTIKKK